MSEETLYSIRVVLDDDAPDVAVVEAVLRALRKLLTIACDESVEMLWRTLWVEVEHDVILDRDIVSARIRADV